MRWYGLSRRLGSLAIALLTAAIIVISGSLQAQESQPDALLREGQSLYKAGQYAAAADTLQAASLAFAATGDRPQQVATAINLALVYQQLSQWPAAIASLDTGRQLLAQEPPLPEASYLQGSLWEVQGQVELARGQTVAALQTWRQASQAYAAAGRDRDRDRSELLQNQALQQLGHYRDALKQLAAIAPLWSASAPSRLQAEGWRQLGRVVRVVGDLPGLEDYWSQLGSELADADYLDKAEQLLARSERAFETLQLLPEQVATWLDLAAVDQTRYFRNRDLAERASYGTELLGERLLDQVKPLLNAQQRYQQVQQVAPTLLVRLQAQLKEFDLVLEARRRQATGDWANLSSDDRARLAWATETLPIATIEAELATLPDSRATLYAELKLSKQAIDSQVWGQPLAMASPDWVARVLARASARAERLGDRHALSYARGYLGQLHEIQQDWAEARDLTAAASFLAEGLNSPELSYEWAWQLGRILAAQHQNEAAIAAYEIAVKHLDALRAQLLGAGNPDFQFLFRDRVEPVYRELLALLLPPEQAASKQQSPADALAPPSEARLQRARAVVEELQVAELEDFLRCQLPGQNPMALDRYVERTDTQTAVIYPIAIGDRLGLIAKFPQQDALIYRTHPDLQAVRHLEQAIQALRRAVKQRRDWRSDPSFSQVYDYLLGPLASDLATSAADTLVFSLDSALRNVPLAALYDSQHGQYLIERYQIAVNIGLEVPDRPPLQLPNIPILAAGVSEENCESPAACESGQRKVELPYVEAELKAIASRFPQAQVLHNRAFSVSALQQSLHRQSFPIVHLATHGEFTSDPKTTKILPYHSSLNLNQLSNLLRVQGEAQPQPVDLLVLSACATAIGDRRATLGMAGIAIQSGASSTIASLFNINDRATAELMDEFYSALAQPDVGKAAALRAAQLSLLHDPDHPDYHLPRFWSPHILIGNWR